MSVIQFFLLFIGLVSAYKPLSDSFLRNVPSGDDDFDTANGALLFPLMMPRVPGTEEHEIVQRHFIDFFDAQLPKWTMEWQNSTSKTPATGDTKMQFSNLIFKREPPWTKPGQANFLTLVAHYDSIYSEDYLVGATSAAPCAILMHVARSIDKYMTQMHDEMSALGEGGTIQMDMGIQILLLSGKEAYVNKTNYFDVDFLYGSRSLAEQWEATLNPPGSLYPNRLSQTRLFVNLDALGAPNPRVPSYFITTDSIYQDLAMIEYRMRELSLLETAPPPAPAASSGEEGQTGAGMFMPEDEQQSVMYRASDVIGDHAPFMARGVPVLNIVSSPFPVGFQTASDDERILDVRTVRDWGRIVTAFAMEWLDMMEVWEDEN